MLKLLVESNIWMILAKSNKKARELASLLVDLG
jgi:hypothetical protein